jgi:hypothetical protein
MLLSADGVDDVPGESLWLGSGRRCARGLKEGTTTMRTEPLSSFRAVALPILAVLVALGAPAALWADGLTPFEQNVEMMMEAQGANGTLIARAWGIDVASPLSFTSSTNEADQSFTCSSLPGSTYLGESISVEVSGAYNEPLEIWELSSLIQRGDESCEGTGTAQFATRAETAEAEWAWPVVPGHPMLLDYHLETTYGIPGPTISIGLITSTVNHLETGRYRCRDRLQADGTWKWQQKKRRGGRGDDFGVVSEGFVDPGTGDGFSTMVIGPSPADGDLNGDGDVDQSDLGILLSDWGCANWDCPGDCDWDGDTDQSDLGVLLADWGS